MIKTTTGKTFTSKGQKAIPIGDDYGHCDEEDPTSLSSPEIKMCIRNHTASLIMDWTWYMGLAYFFCEMLGTAMGLFAHMNAVYWFGGSSSINAIVRAFIIGASTSFVKYFFGRVTTMHLDPIRSIAGTVTFIVTRGRKMGDGRIWVELVKLPFFVIAQFLGVLVVLALLGATTDTEIKTLDCALVVPTPAVCAIYPVKGVGVSTAALAWQEALGAMGIYGSLVIAERFFCWKYPGTIESAIFYGLGTFMVHAWWGVSSGNSFNFWYWSMTGWFSNIDDDDKGTRVWPLILGVAVVALFDIAVYYLWSWYKSSNSRSKMSSD